VSATALPPGASAEGARRAAISHAANARDFYAPIIPIVVELHRQGHSLRAIARELDRRGILTRIGHWYEPDSGKRRPVQWNAAQVRRVLIRAGVSTSATKPPRRGIYLRLDGDSKGPFDVRHLRLMIDASLISLWTMGRRDDVGDWHPLRDLLGVAA
jgi:hypothetical protein